MREICIERERERESEREIERGTERESESNSRCIFSKVMYGGSRVWCL